MSGGLLFWTLYYSGLGAFEGGTLCERVQQALFVRVVVQKIALFEGFGFGIFLPKEDKQNKETKAPDNAWGWEFFILGLLLFWVISQLTNKKLS